MKVDMYCRMDKKLEEIVGVILKGGEHSCITLLKLTREYVLNGIIEPRIGSRGGY